MEKEPKIENTNLPFDVINLIDSEISSDHKFFESSDRPNKIIRVEDGKELIKKHKGKFELIELVEEAKKLYTELEEKYGIIVPAEFFIGKDKTGNDVIYSVVDKIEGKRFEDIEKTDEDIKKVEALYTSVAKYLLDKFKEGGLYLWDICGESQYIYGKKVGEDEDKIYLIDTDIWLNNSKNSMYLVVYWLTRHISGEEKHFNTQFSEARDCIQEFVNQPLPDNIKENDMENITGIKEFLENKKSNYNPKSAIPDFE